MLDTRVPQQGIPPIEVHLFRAQRACVRLPTMDTVLVPPQIIDPLEHFPTGSACARIDFVICMTPGPRESSKVMAGSGAGRLCTCRGNEGRGAVSLTAVVVGFKGCLKANGTIETGEGVGARIHVEWAYDVFGG